MSLNFDTLFGPYQDKILINYDWTDVDSATGYVIYDGIKTTDSVSSKYMLEKSSERWNLWSSSLAIGWGSGDYRDLTEVLDIDFDTSTFKKSRTIRGKAYIKIKYSTGGLGGGDISFYAIAKIRKWNGTTETEIVSVQSPTRNEAVDLDSYFSMSVDVPETAIAVGEQIRLTLGIWVDTTIDDTTYGNIAINPQDSTTGIANARLVFSCPYKIDTTN